MPLGTLTSKGQITVPKSIRQELKLRTGDRLDFQIEQDGSARIRPVTKRVAEVRGMLSAFRKSKPVSVKEMDENLAEYFRKTWK